MKPLTKKLILFFIILFTGCSEIGSSQSEQTTDSEKACDSSSCYIYYDSFAIQRLYGLPEKEIKNHAILYDFDYQDLRSILKDTVPLIYQSGCNTSSYCDGDVKAQIVLHDNTYFVDSMGYMRKGKLIYRIDKSNFQELMKMKEKNN